MDPNLCNRPRPSTTRRLPRYLTFGSLPATAVQVDSTSDRALDAVAQAAAGLAALRRMVLANPHTGVTSSRVVQAALL